MSEFKSGFIAIVGRPNAGKSTLLNKILGEKIAIISSKPQTTRNKILGIFTEEDCQIIFVDTPGVHRPRTSLGEFMINEVKSAIGGVDAAILVVDAGREVGDAEEEIIKNLKAQNIPAILAVNKVDAVQKENMLPIIAKLSGMYNFDDVIPISAKHGDGVDLLLDSIKKHLEEGPMYYPEDMITDKTEREIASEVIREKLLRLLDKEIPHGTAVEINAMHDEENIVKIEANIYCEKSSHKQIIIGKGGAQLKKVGTYAREDLEKFFGKKVYLQLWVKVKESWRNNNFMLKTFGYTEEK